MSEYMYKYLNIGLLALLVLVLLGSLITFAVCQESIDTVFAADVNGYYPNNILPMSDSSMMNFNTIVSNTTEIIYTDSNVYFTLSGDGSIVDNLMTKGSSNLVFSIYANTSIQLSNTTWFAVSLTESSSQNTQVQLLYPGNNNFQNIYYNLSWKYVSRYTAVSSSYSQGDLIMKFTLDSGTVAINWFCLYTGQHNNITSFPGYVPKTYSNYGYDQGFTDGVNSASGGGGIHSLSGLTWIAPDELTTSSSVGHYSINGTYKITSRNGNIYERPFYALNTYVLPSGSNFYHCMDVVCDDWVSPDDSDWDAHIYWISPDDVLTFVDGTDIENSTLITFLSDNGSFGAYSDGYTDGYQDGYNHGHTIGYDEGYNKGVTESNLTLSGTYNLIGSLLTLGTVSSTINNKTYVAYASEEESFVANGTRYRGQYYDTQGDSNVYLGLVIDYDFYLSVKINTVLYGLALSQSRWNQVGFKILCVNKNDNSQYFYVSKYDTQYWTYFQTIYSDNVNGLYQFAECTISFPDNDPYFLIFIPEVDPTLRIEGSDSFDDSTILMFDNTYFLTQGSGSLSYDDYNYLINDAYDRGAQYGRSTGYDSGREAGYNIGYSKGVEDAGEYTFNGLLGAVFDAPITMFIGKYNSETGLREGGLLNFNLLGVNLGGFVIALLSLGLILFILRLFIRGL